MRSRMVLPGLTALLLGILLAPGCSKSTGPSGPFYVGTWSGIIGSLTGSELNIMVDETGAASGNGKWTYAVNGILVNETFVLQACSVEEDGHLSGVCRRTGILPGMGFITSVDGSFTGDLFHQTMEGTGKFTFSVGGGTYVYVWQVSKIH